MKWHHGIRRVKLALECLEDRVLHIDLLRSGSRPD